MRLKLNPHALDGDQVVDVVGDDGRLCGSIFARRGGLHVVSSDLVGCVFMEEDRPPSLDVFFSRELMSLSRDANTDVQASESPPGLIRELLSFLPDPAPELELLPGA